ncbi:MAG: radical SAM protein [SAR202 cluster bacterium]|nr:radical SAM protein [SAR202 cluster bacterium]
MPVVDTEREHVFLDPNIARKGGELERHIRTKYSGPDAPPLFSLIEFNLSGLCNRKCVFCPRSNPEVYPNRNEHLPLDLYEKIMKELAQTDYDGLLLYSAFGEPLLYKKIEVIIEMSKRYLPRVRIESVTDGDFVTPKKLHALFGAGLDTLLISMYDGPEQEVKFSAMRDEVGLTDKQVILRRRWLPPEEHFGITLSNRAGMVEIPQAGVFKLSEPLKRKCFYPFYQILVDYDGAVLLCPHDWGKKIIVGNLREKTVYELWNGRVIKRVRQSLARADRNFPPCDVCDVDGRLMGQPHFDKWMKYYESQPSGRALPVTPS